MSISMAFTEAVRTVFKEKYATFSGRASRSEFWWSYLLYVLGLIAFVIAISGTLVAALSDIASLSLMIAVPVTSLAASGNGGISNGVY
ncbi:DUF805 domain-containing protein [Rhizobium sp. 969_B3_N1_2]|uniref:DUF805 domain-containing protein n=1 Tax=Rhizobium sp. 969_B3_N1_2 TaxID=3276278 RepID=UPI003F2064E8